MMARVLLTVLPSDMACHAHPMCRIPSLQQHAINTSCLRAVISIEAKKLTYAKNSAFDQDDYISRNQYCRPVSLLRHAERDYIPRRLWALTKLAVMESSWMEVTLCPLARKPATMGAVLLATDCFSSYSTTVRLPLDVEMRRVTRTMGSLRLALGVTVEASAGAGTPSHNRLDIKDPVMLAGRLSDVPVCPYRCCLLSLKEQRLGMSEAFRIIGGLSIFEALRQSGRSCPMHRCT